MQFIRVGWKRNDLLTQFTHTRIRADGASAVYYGTAGTKSSSLIPATRVSVCCRVGYLKKNMGLCAPEGPRRTPSAAMKYCSTNGRIVLLLLLRSIKTTRKRREEKRKKRQDQLIDPGHHNRCALTGQRFWIYGEKKIGSSFLKLCAHTPHSCWLFRSRGSRRPVTQDVIK